jgi:hypothetical protein
MQEGDAERRAFISLPLDPCHKISRDEHLSDLIVVRLKAPHWSGYSSVVRRDWKQLIGRKPAHTTAVKTGLGETPPERGIPRRIELRQIKINTRHSVGRSKTIILMTTILRVP